MSQKRTAAQADAAAAAAGIAQAALSQGEGPPSSVAGGRTAARGTGVPPPLVSGEELVALAETLGHFSPTIPDDVIRHYLHKAGLETSDPRVVSLISLATQKFIAEVAEDSMQYSKQRSTTTGTSSKRSSKEKKLVLTVPDLSRALGDQGVTVARPQYYI